MFKFVCLPTQGFFQRRMIMTKRFTPPTTSSVYKVLAVYKDNTTSPGFFYLQGMKFFIVLHLGARMPDRTRKRMIIFHINLRKRMLCLFYFIISHLPSKSTPSAILSFLTLKTRQSISLK